MNEQPFDEFWRALDRMVTQQVAEETEELSADLTAALAQVNTLREALAEIAAIPVEAQRGHRACRDARSIARETLAALPTEPPQEAQS